jgi:hypothetical protein
MVARKVRGGLIAIAVVLGFGIAAPAPAQADEDGFVRRVQEQFVFLSADRLTPIGQKICQMESSGTPSPDVVNMVYKDMAVSMFAASQIVSIATAELGC